MRSATTTVMAKRINSTLPAVVIGKIPIIGFMEFIEAWKMATAQMFPFVLMKIHVNMIVIKGYIPILISKYPLL